MQQVRRMVEGQRLREAPDEELLRLFQAGRDEASFRALLRRHGPMVWDVCRTVLRGEADAEDAFQATFLVLARDAGSIRQSASLGGWLYGVAYRTALKARAESDKRRKYESRVSGRPAPPAEDLTWDEAKGVLHEELNRLAERYRTPLVLCYLQGKTQDEAAARLGLSKGTLKRRLEQGRALLRARLVRRGLGPAAALIVSAWPASAASAVPATLMASTIKAASLAAAGQMVSGVIVAKTALVEGAMQTMLPPKIKIAATVLLALATVGIGAGLLAYQAGAPGEAGSRRGQDSVAANAKGSEPEKDWPARADLFGDPLPEGALARMGTVRLRHRPIGTLTTAFSPDRKILASCADEIHLWDAATGKLLRTIRDGNRTMNYCALLFVPESRWLAGAGRESVCVWDTATGRRLHEFPANGQAVACSPDGKRLAAPSKDGWVSVWDLTTGRRVARLGNGQAKEFQPPSFTADGKGLVTVSGSRICHWDLAEGTLRKTVELPIPQNSGLVLSQDGQTVGVITRDGPISLWDATTGRERVKLRGDPAPRGSCFALSADAKTLAVNETGRDENPDETTIALWDAKTGEVLRRLHIPSRHVTSLLFSPDGRTLLTTSHEPLIRLWDAATGKPILQWPAHTHAAESLAFTPDGRFLVSGGLDGSVRFWEVTSGRQVRELAGHRWRCDVVAVAPDGKAILSGGADGCIRLQDQEGKQLHRILLDGPPEERAAMIHQVLALGVTPDGKVAATWSRNFSGGPPVYHLWDLATGKALGEHPDLSRSGTVPQFSPDARLALEDLYEERAAGPAPAPGGGGMAPYSGRGPVGVLLREVATGREMLRMRFPGESDGLQAFTSDGRSLVSITSKKEKSGDGLRYVNTIHLWELATGKERLTVSCGSWDLWIQRVACAPDARTLATARADGTIQFWDLLNGKELLRRMESGSETSRLAFSPDSRLLASGHRNGVILVWDAAFTGRREERREGKPDAGQRERWWDDLAGEDARKAYAAIRDLVSAPEQSIQLFRDRLRPVAEAPADKLRPLLADLDSPEFERRRAAAKELTALGERAGPALRAALQAGPSTEQRRRIEAILDTHNAAPSGEGLRHLRAVEVLERIGSDEARKVLETLTKGVPEARLTREAQATLQRLARRPPAMP
jgi:RNA polymerase sigma factor (sigma-70 family)